MAPSPMLRIVVMGAGGTGGFFGGCLARAGHDVTFIARGRHLEAIRAEGLRIESASAGDFTLRPARATDDPREVGPVDLVLFCVKSWDTDAAADAIRPLVAPDTVIVPTLNGIEATDRIGRVVGADHVLGGVAHIVASIAGPGHILHTSRALHHLTFGEPGGGASKRTARLLRALDGCGFDVRASSDIRVDLWSKFLFLSALSGIGAVTRLPFGPMRKTPEVRALVADAMREAEAVARAQGIPLPDDVVARQLERSDLLGATERSSMARDLLEGRRLELETLSGAVVRLGRQLGVATPVHAFTYACLRPYENGAPDA